MAYESNTATFARKSEAPARTAMSAPLFDWMMLLQRQALNFQQQALGLYGLGGSAGRFTGTVSNSRKSVAPQEARDVEVIPLGRETLNVGTRVVNQGTTRVRRFVIETPVEEKVPLRQERVIIERRRPIAVSSTGDTLTEKTIEMSDTTEVPVVWTSVELAEEVVVRREVNERIEAVRGVVRHDEVEIQEIGGQAPTKALEQRADIVTHAESNAAAKQGMAKLEAASQVAKPAESKPAAASFDVKSGDIKTGNDAKPGQDAKVASGVSHEPARSVKA